MLEELKSGELAAGEIGGRFAISAPSISRHLAILKAAELVTERRDGNRILYRLEPATLIGSLNGYLSAVCPTQVRHRRRIAARRT
jgi:DNA-binding transcriptional ArsR family regulator